MTHQETGLPILGARFDESRLPFYNSRMDALQSFIEPLTCIMAGAWAYYLAAWIARRFKFSPSNETLLMIAIFLLAFIVVGGGFEYLRNHPAGSGEITADLKAHGL